MNQHTQNPTLADERALPIGLVVVPAFVGGLLWLLTVLSPFFAR